MANTTIPSELIAADAITGAKIADNAVDSEHYTDGSIDTAHIADSQVTVGKMAANSVDSDQYVDGSIDTAHIADDQVTLAKMAGLARGKIIVGDSSGNPAALAIGTSGYVLKSDGTDIAWAADADTAALTTEQVQDIAGAMFSSNTETGITATYQDADGTIDLVVGTLNQNTTGSAATLTTARTIGGTSFDGSANIAVGLAATATTLATARTIGGVSFNGSANIDLPGVNTAGNQNVDAALVDGENFKINGGQGSDGQVLTSTGSGVAWEDAASGGETNRLPLAGGTMSGNITMTSNVLYASELYTASRLGHLDDADGYIDFADNSIVFAPAGEVMRCVHTGSAGGTLRIGTTSVLASSAEKMAIQGVAGLSIKVTSYANYQPLILWNNASTANSSSTLVYIAFLGLGGTQVGSVSSVGSTTSYNTSSDYRLKENVDYTWDATTRLKQLKPARFNWIEDETNTLVDGFLAHEVSSIVPEAITGVKDETETNENCVLGSTGNLEVKGVTEAEWTAGKIPVLWTEDDVLPDGVSVGDVKEEAAYASDTTWTASHTQDLNQSIDQSKLVPLLVKTIQELEARITVLEG